ncbi:nuclear factor 7, brain-like [Protopterus annectens]|uniref:nuclear factor 7, brain-like n=1 Tax=Protopterus annectens TaxID=7888 RepID=UPI001CFA28D3|nr:nuclear factor 7, brain-like [Protopterus annectens]
MHWQEFGSCVCPHCSTVFEGDNFRTNKLLNNITEYLQQRQLMATEMHSYPLCTEHQKKLERFCITDTEVICLDCRDSRKHLHHEVLNAQEAAGEFKEQLKKSLKNLSHKRDQQNSIIENFEAQLNAIPEKTKAVEEQIKKSFGKLHAFLYEEENALLRKLHEDEEQLRQILEQRIQIIKNDLQLLTTGVDEIEKSIEEGDEISFLMKLKKMQERTNIPSKDVDLSPVALSDDQYAGPLQYWIWRKMLNILELTPEPVKLNPETACPFLILDGQTRVRCGDKKRSVPDLPERFDPAACVLGNTGFDSGRYYWEVDVGIKTEWGLGVAKDSVT